MKYLSRRATMWGVLRTLQLATFLYIMTCFVDCRQFHMRVSPVRMSLYGSVLINKARRMTECVYSCIQQNTCSSMSFNKTSHSCYLYSNAIAATMDTNSVILHAELRQKSGQRTHKSSSPPFSRESVVLKKGKMSWLDAESLCRRDNGVLFQIDSAVKQATAVKMAKESGLVRVAIGVRRGKQGWVYMDKTPVTYSGWAPGQPKKYGNLDLFAVLSKWAGYKWKAAAIFYPVHGNLCQKEKHQ